MSTQNVAFFTSSELVVVGTLCWSFYLRPPRCLDRQRVTAAMTSLVGTWERVRTENMDAYLEVLGIPEQFRKVAKEQKETFIIANEGAIWKTRYIAGKMEENVAFKLGEPTDYMSVLGKTMTGTINFVGNQMVEEHLLDNLKMAVTREVVDGQMYMTTTTNGVTCKAWLDRK